jgi:hypothetical protein
MILMVAVWMIRPGSPKSFEIIQHWLKGTYLWGYPGIGPPDLHFDPNKDLPLWKWILQFFLFNSLWVLKVISLRVYYFLVPFRPFYSRIHNITVLGISLVVYGLAVWGTLKIERREGTLLWFIFLVQTALVALTWSDPDNRGLDRMMPFLTILAAGGGFAFWNFLNKSGPVWNKDII